MSPNNVLGSIVVSHDTIKDWYWKYNYKNYDIEEAQHSGQPTNNDETCLPKLLEED